MRPLHKPETIVSRLLIICAQVNNFFLFALKASHSPFSVEYYSLCQFVNPIKPVNVSWHLLLCITSDFRRYDRNFFQNRHFVEKNLCCAIFIRDKN